MTANGLAQLFTRMNYLWGDPVEKNTELARQWYAALEAIDDEAIFEALPILAQRVDRRPSIAQLIAQAKVALAGRPAPPQLTEGKRYSPYAAACWAAGMAAWEGRLPRAKLDALAGQHAQFFTHHDQATPEMVAAMTALAGTGEAVGASAEGPTKRKFESRYSEAHKAQYLANADRYFAEKTESEKETPS